MLNKHLVLNKINANLQSLLFFAVYINPNLFIKYNSFPSMHANGFHEAREIYSFSEDLTKTKEAASVVTRNWQLIENGGRKVSPNTADHVFLLNKEGFVGVWRGLA